MSDAPRYEGPYCGCHPLPDDRDAHDGWSFDLTTPRQYTARGGWNVYCACGEHIGESGDADLAERHAQHVASVTSPREDQP